MAAANILRHRNHFTCEGVPVGNSGFTVYGLLTHDTCYDQTGKKMYRWTGNAWIEDNTYGAVGASGGTPVPGPPGTAATITVGTVQTTTLAAGSQATASVTDVDSNASAAKFNFAFGIPQGLKGQDGSGGGGGTGETPYIMVKASGGDDRGAIQAAIDQNALNNKPVVLSGNLKISGEITIAKANFKLTIFAYGAKVESTNQNPFTFFKRTMPIDNSDANNYINAQFVIRGGELRGYDNQNAFDLGASYGSHYEDISMDTFNEGINLRFALNTTVVNCETTNCINPFIAGIGNWPGANNANSQSNHSTFQHCRCYMPPEGNQAFLIFASSGCAVRDCIIEGHAVVNGINFESNLSTVVRDGLIENIHFECVSGASNAFIKCNHAAGCITINKAYGSYPALFLDTKSTTDFTIIQISNIPWWKVKNGKFIKRQGDVRLKLENVMVEGPTHISGSNVMSYIDNSGTNYRTPYYFEDATGKLAINIQR